jgi:hypothetical protein
VTLEPRQSSAERAPARPLEFRVKLTDLARPPTPVELQAIAIALEQVLAAPLPPAAEPAQSDWRFSGRWWRPAAGGPGRRWASTAH